jgi:hypothetical protein
LGKRGLIEERDGVFYIFSPSFERWIRHEMLSAPGEAETEISAEEWLKSGGHEDIKGNRNVLPRFKKKYWPLVGAFMKELSMKVAASVVTELVKGLW